MMWLLVIVLGLLALYFYGLYRRGLARRFTITEVAVLYLIDETFLTENRKILWAITQKHKHLDDASFMAHVLWDIEQHGLTQIMALHTMRRTGIMPNLMTTAQQLRAMPGPPPS